MTPPEARFQDLRRQSQLAFHRWGSDRRLPDLSCCITASPRMRPSTGSSTGVVIGPGRRGAPGHRDRTPEATRLLSRTSLIPLPPMDFSRSRRQDLLRTPRSSCSLARSRTSSDSPWGRPSPSMRPPRTAGSASSPSSASGDGLLEAPRRSPAANLQVALDELWRHFASLAEQDRRSRSGSSPAHLDAGAGAVPVRDLAVSSPTFLVSGDRDPLAAGRRDRLPQPSGRRGLVVVPGDARNHASLALRLRQKLLAFLEEEPARPSSAARAATSPPDIA